MITREALNWENKKIKQLRTVVDLTSAILKQSKMTREEAENLVAVTKQRVSKLFPEKGQTFELILKPRFQRIIDERFEFLESRLNGNE